MRVLLHTTYTSTIAKSATSPPPSPPRLPPWKTTVMSFQASVAKYMVGPQIIVRIEATVRGSTSRLSVAPRNLFPTHRLCLPEVIAHLPPPHSLSLILLRSLRPRLIGVRKYASTAGLSVGASFLLPL